MRCGKKVQNSILQRNTNFAVVGNIYGIILNFKSKQGVSLRNFHWGQCSKRGHFQWLKGTLLRTNMYMFIPTRTHICTYHSTVCRKRSPFYHASVVCSFIASFCQRNVSYRGLPVCEKVDLFSHAVILIKPRVNLFKKNRLTLTVYSV